MTTGMNLTGCTISGLSGRTDWDIDLYVTLLSIDTRWVGPLPVNAKVLKGRVTWWIRVNGFFIDIQIPDLSLKNRIQSITFSTLCIGLLRRSQLAPKSPTIRPVVQFLCSGKITIYHKVTFLLDVYELDKWSITCIPLWWVVIFSCFTIMCVPVPM